MPPYGSSQEGKASQRERLGEGTRPYEEFQINGYNLLSLCRALLCAEIKCEAIPKRRRCAVDDRAVLIAALAY